MMRDLEFFTIHILFEKRLWNGVEQSKVHG